MRERMLREARALGGLSHPNVITVYDVVDAGGEPMVVLEMVPSRNLATLISEQGVLSTAQAAVVGFATVGRTARGAPRRDHPPRRQAGQRPGRPRRPGQAHRLRHRPQRRRRPDDDGGPGPRLPRLHRAGGRRGPARDPGRRPVGAGRDAVRRGRGTPALRRARRSRLDDHRGRRRRGAPPQRGRPRRRRDRRADGQGAGEADVAGRGAAAAAAADRRPGRPAVPGLAGRADDGGDLPGAPELTRQAAAASSGGSGPAGRRTAPPVTPPPGVPAAPVDVLGSARTGRVRPPLAASPGPLPEALRAPAPPCRRAPRRRRTTCRPRSAAPRRARPRPLGRPAAPPSGSSRPARPWCSPGSRGLGRHPGGLGAVAADHRDGGVGRRGAARAHRRPGLHRAGAAGLVGDAATTGRSAS